MLLCLCISKMQKTLKTLEVTACLYSFLLTAFTQTAICRMDKSLLSENSHYTLSIHRATRLAASASISRKKKPSFQAIRFFQVVLAVLAYLQRMQMRCGPHLKN